jgi:sigma-B regulation protein RsbU (phosphoserine phosphatase)
MKDSPELRAAIRAASAFRELSDNNLAILIEAAELETFDPDAILMVQGETSDFAMLILEGEVTVSADSARGAIPISTLHAPSLVGELGALAQLPRSATARACTSVTVLRFGREALVEVACATPSLLIDVIGRMGDRMRKFNGAISLYTEALDALEHHKLDPVLLEELRNPIPDLADFGQTFHRMAEQIILRRQRDDEMASAAVIQRALLPRVRQFADESALDVWAAMTPARDVGGDFFDLVPLADGRVALGVGDVCGKGVPAALFMGITKTLIRINLRENPDLPGAIVKANAFLADNNAGQLFATALYAAYDPRSGELEYCNCGHLPGLIRRPGGAVETLPVGGLPVGLFEPMKVTLHKAQLRPGDLFFLYTDGVTEAEDPGAVQFGEQRLADLLAKKGHGARASQWIARVEAAVGEFARGRSQLDDITCLALRR